MNTETIWKILNKQLKAFIIDRIPDKSYAEDILQEVFIKIHNNIDKLEDKLKIRSWVYQIARNTIIDFYRKNKLQISDNELIDELPYLTDEESEAENNIKSGLEELVLKLPMKYSEALILTEFQGLSQIKLAEQLGISKSGAKSRVQRGRQMVKDMLMNCCHFEFDKYGTIIDYHPITCCCCKHHKE